jgi:tetratricopeptide (TPR) repeat protein
MTTTDHWGAPVRATRAGAVALDHAIWSLVALAGDPVAAIRGVATADPDCLLGRVLGAYLALYAMTGPRVADARAVLQTCAAVAEVDRRTGHHLAAAGAWADGEWEEAARLLGVALADEPRDLLALKVAQDLYFFLGDTDALCAVVASVADAWPTDRPGWGWVDGMLAFGLEENGDYRAAEGRARRALRRQPSDVWATHALAHVFEMEGRCEEGSSFLTASSPHWASSYFAGHNWWHLSLYLIEQGRLNEALSVYDEHLHRAETRQWLEVVDMAALLWRLTLTGVDVSHRAQALAGHVRAALDDPVSVFHDLHAVMLFGLAGDPEGVAEVTERNRTDPVGTNRRVVAQVGMALLEGFGHFVGGRADDAVAALVPTLGDTHLIGGSIAQRDIVELTALAAAARSGADDIVGSLVAQRITRRPSTAAATERLVGANQR